MGWLNAVAPRNMSCMLVTEETLQSPIGWLKADAAWNI